MNRLKKAMIIALSGALAILTLAGCGNSTDVSDATQNADAGINIRVGTAQLRDIDKEAVYTGELICEDTAYVTSKVSAKVESIKVNLGDWVNKGDVLVVLDSSDYELQLKQANAAYSQAEAACSQAETAYSNVLGVNKQTESQLAQALSASEIAYNDAKANYERQKELYEKGSISLVAYESAKSAYSNAELAYDGAKKNYDTTVNIIAPGNEKSAKSSITTAQASLKSASLAIEQAEIMIGNTVIKAPISGYVSSKTAMLGQFASPGMALFTISNSNELLAEIKVTESVVPYVKVGSRAAVSVSAAEADSIFGKVVLVNPVKDTATGMYIVRISVDNKDDMLKAGMFADVTIITEESVKDAVAIPSNAIMQEGSEYYVYTVNENTAEKRWVKLGVSDGEYTNVKEGLSPGELVVTDGKEYLSDANNLVNIVD